MQYKVSILNSYNDKTTFRQSNDTFYFLLYLFLISFINLNKVYSLLKLNRDKEQIQGIDVIFLNKVMKIKTFSCCFLLAIISLIIAVVWILC